MSFLFKYNYKQKVLVVSFFSHTIQVVQNSNFKYIMQGKSLLRNNKKKIHHRIVIIKNVFSNTFYPNIYFIPPYVAQLQKMNQNQNILLLCIVEP